MLTVLAVYSIALPKTGTWPKHSTRFYISLSGIVTFKNATELQEVARKLPLDRLLIETDSPYLAPMPYRGKPNQPAYVVEVAQFLADLHQMPLNRFAQTTTDNFYQLFKKAKRT